VKALNQAERHPVAVEDQVVQIYAATNGYLDRITVDKVDKFLSGLTEWMQGNEPELLKKIAEGDWSDETQSAIEKAVQSYAEDFGFDLDEEGHPLEEGGDEPPPAHRRDDEAQADESRDENGEKGEKGEKDEREEKEEAEEKEQTVPA
jgi:F-type H+-transporting ATPase subunit alpha